MVLLNPKLILNKKNSLPIEGYFFYAFLNIQQQLN